MDMPDVPAIPLCLVFMKDMRIAVAMNPAGPTFGAVPSPLHLLPLEPCHGPKFGLFTEPED